MDEVSNDLIAISKVNQLLFEIIKRRNNGKKEVQQGTKTVVKKYVHTLMKITQDLH